MCRIFHKWDKWSEPLPFTRSAMYPNGKVTEVHVEVQERYCLNCNKVQRRNAK